MRELIFLVVLAHCVSSYRPAGGINQALYNYLCTICMPTLIFVSGMFSQVKDREKYKIGILRILETYVVFQLIRTIPPMLISGNITLSSILIQAFRFTFRHGYLPHQEWICMVMSAIIMAILPSVT